MERRSCSIAVAAFAALAALSAESAAQSPLLQDTRPGGWTLLSERSAWSDDTPLMPQAVSPAGVSAAGLGWVRYADLKPGSGLLLDLAPSWAMRADWDRQRPGVAQVRETVDTFLLGVQYRFR
jgi:hypothetical protein